MARLASTIVFGNLTINGIASGNGSGLTSLNASNISSGTLSFDRINTITIAKGGTGLISLGTANQLLRVNTGATALEYFTPTWTSNTGTVTSVTGTTNQITVATGTTTPVLSIPTDFRAPGSIRATTIMQIGSGTNTWNLDGTGSTFKVFNASGYAAIFKAITADENVAYESFVTPRLATIYTFASSTGTLNTTHTNGVVISTFGGAQTLTLTSGLDIGTQITVIRNTTNTSNVTIARSGTETINGATSVVFSGQFSAITLIKISSTAWIKVGAD